MRCPTNLDAPHNHFTYGNANPISFRDPTGRSGCGIFDFFCDAVGDAVDAIGGAVSDVVDAVDTGLSAAFDQIEAYANDVGNAISTVIEDVGGEAGALLGEAEAALGDALPIVEAIGGGLFETLALPEELIAGAAVLVVLAAGVVVYGIVNSNGTVTYTIPNSGSADPKTGSQRATSPAGDGSSGSTSPGGAPEPKVAPPVQKPKPKPITVVRTTSRDIHKSNTTHSEWYEDGFIHNRTDRYTYTNTLNTTYYSNGTSRSHWTGWRLTSHTWSIATTNVLDIANPAVTEIKPPKPYTPFISDTHGTSTGTCGAGGTASTCLTHDGNPLPPDATTSSPNTDAGGGGAKPPANVSTGSDSCDGENLVSWVNEGGNLRAGMSAGMRADAYLYQSGAAGARSSISGYSQAPQLSGGGATAKFDGVDCNDLIDRKLNPMWTSKAADQAVRQATVARYYGLNAIWELPDSGAAAAATRFLDANSIMGITVRVSP